MNEPLVEMFRYNRWANLTLFESCRALTEEQLDRHVDGTSGTIREILQHIAGGQQSFILRTMGRQHENELTRRSPWPGMERLIEVVGATSDELIEIASALVDERVELPFMGKRFRFPRRFFLVHAMAHGAEHRAEVALALTALGISSPDLDRWNYATAAGFGEEVTG